MIPSARAVAPAVWALLLCAAPLGASATQSRERTPLDGTVPPWSAYGRDGVVELRSPAWPMAKIVGGAFTMGSTPSEVLSALTLCQKEPMGHRCEETFFSDEQPRRSVQLSAYWLDRHEVTQRDYARCVQAGRCAPPRTTVGGRRFLRPDLPVSFVSHRDAETYCRFRGARLPTEAEWERAARGPTGRVFPWGNLYNDRVANHGKFAWSRTDAIDGFAELGPVGSFPEGATPDRIFDLAGNVAEWVHDRYLPAYAEADVHDPLGPSSPPAGAERVVRGGGYHDGAAWLRGAARRAADPGVRRPDVGLRCARDASPTPP